MPNSENFLASKPILTWTSFPLIDRPKTSLFLVLFLIILSVGLWWIAVISWKMPIFYVLGILFVMIELSPYFIPTSYEIYEHKIHIYYPFVDVERDYSLYKCFYLDKLGILLGTYSRPSRMDRFRGQSLRFSKTKEEKEQLIAILKEKIGKQY